MFMRSAKLAVLLALSFMLVSLSGIGQSLEGADKKAEDKAAEKTADKARPKHRLPPHYSKVVDKTQREKIYSIQDKYAPELDELNAKIKAVLAKRDAEIEQVLTPEQKAKVHELAAQNKSKGGKEAVEHEEAEEEAASPVKASGVGKSAAVPKKK